MKQVSLELPRGCREGFLEEEEEEEHPGRVLTTSRRNCPHGINTLVEESEVKVLVTQSCLTLCNPMDCSLPGSSVHGILQARILEWVAIPFSRGFS